MKIKIALAKGRVARKAIERLKIIGYSFPDYTDQSRKLVFKDITETVEFFLVKSPDVPVYVEKGAADIGIVGKDILIEHPANVYEVLDLEIGQCRMCVAGIKNKLIDFSKRLVVGTKYPNIARQYFNSRDQMVEIIKLNGSVELAPVIGLSDVIVDIVESGSTLRENGLSVLEDICQISSRLIVNKVSLKTKNEAIESVVSGFKKCMSFKEVSK